MSAAAQVLSTSSVNPEGKWASDYLENLCESYEYSIQYVTAEECYDMVTRPAAPAEDMEIYEKLMAGESVISSIHYSTRLNDYFLHLDSRYNAADRPSACCAAPSVPTCC